MNFDFQIFRVDHTKTAKTFISPSLEQVHLAKNVLNKWPKTGKVTTVLKIPHLMLCQAL